LYGKHFRNHPEKTRETKGKSASIVGRIRQKLPQNVNKVEKITGKMTKNDCFQPKFIDRGIVLLYTYAQV